MADHLMTQDMVAAMGDLDATAMIAARASRPNASETDSRSIAKLVEMLANRPEDY